MPSEMCKKLRKLGANAADVEAKHFLTRNKKSVSDLKADVVPPTPLPKKKEKKKERKEKLPDRGVK